jgi:hypothetical protein
MGLGWNIVDLMSLTLNFWIFIQLIVNAIAEKNIFSIVNLRAYFGVASFIMWIKIFYWMKLFQNISFYVKLITQTLSDVKLFLTLCLFIIFAFANLFYFLNVDSDHKDRALIEYTGYRILDSIIAIY